MDATLRHLGGVLKQSQATTYIVLPGSRGASNLTRRSQRNLIKAGVTTIIKDRNPRQWVKLFIQVSEWPVFYVQASREKHQS